MTMAEVVVEGREEDGGVVEAGFEGAGGFVGCWGEGRGSEGVVDMFFVGGWMDGVEYVVLAVLK